MVSIVYKWLIAFALPGFIHGSHPLFVSVTEISHNAQAGTIEISCKIFTDDFESILRRQHTTTRIDLLDIKARAAMNPLVDGYIQKHLLVIHDGKTTRMRFLGFEQQEEGIVSYFEIDKVDKITKIEVVNTILYESKPQQMGIIHVMVNGQRKSRSVNNPEDRVLFSFD